MQPFLLQPQEPLTNVHISENGQSNCSAKQCEIFALQRKSHSETERALSLFALSG